MRKGYIYKITSPSGKVYIGQTINIKSRINDYKGFETLSNKTKNQSKLYNSLKKYGWDNHIFEIIDECIIGLPIKKCLTVHDNKCIINLREIYWIQEYDSFNNGLNCKPGGGEFYRSPTEQETKEKISEAGKGRIFSQESKKSISNSLLKPIIRSDGKIYESLKAAALDLGVTHKQISLRVRNEIKTEKNIYLKGYSFKFYKSI